MAKQELVEPDVYYNKNSTGYNEKIGKLDILEKDPQYNTPGPWEEAEDANKIESEANINARFTMNFSSKANATVSSHEIFTNSYSRTPKMIKSIEEARLKFEREQELKKKEECEKRAKEKEIEEEKIKKKQRVDPWKGYAEPRIVHSLYYYE